MAAHQSALPRPISVSVEDYRLCFPDADYWRPFVREVWTRQIIKSAPRPYGTLISS